MNPLYQQFVECKNSGMFVLQYLTMLRALLSIHVDPTKKTNHFYCIEQTGI